MGKKQKTILIAVLMILISAWHYLTEIDRPLLHILHRELYLVPIGFSAYWFGTRPGLAVALISILLFLLKLTGDDIKQTVYNVNNLLAIPTFILLAYFIGKYRDAQKARHTKLWEHGGEELKKAEQDKVLLCLDNSQNAFKAARYVANSFSRNGRTTVTVMGFIRDPSTEYFSNPDEREKARAGIETSITNLVDDSKEALLHAGFPPAAVNIEMARLQKESIAERILEAQIDGQYDTIVVGGAKMTKAEEFMLGNIAIKLVRKADCTVITVF